MKRLLALLCACNVDLADREAAFVRDDGQRVICGVGIDSDEIELSEIEHAMRRARAANEVLVLFAHRPNVSVRPERVLAVLDAAEHLELPLLTFPELARIRDRAGVAFAFDDFYVDDWFALRAGLRGRPVTFFVSNWAELSTPQLQALHHLADDGHAIEAHGMGHRDAALYVDRHGIRDYLADEIDPLLEAMTAEGFAPTTFAYPYGSRTAELDDVLLDRFALIRSLTYLDASALSTSPCPY